jgi:hypothetical protein
MSTFIPPEYPDCLTPQNWDKKKGVIAKMAGETGIGASLTKLKKVYDDTDWKIIQVDDRKPKINDFKLPEWEKMCKEAATQGVKELEKLRKAAYETRDLAKETAAKFKKNKLIPKSSTALCEEIETAADHLGVGCNPNSISGFIDTAYKSGRAWLDLTVKLMKDGGLGKAIGTVKSSLEGLESPPDWKKANIFSKTRQVTQILGNAVKVANAGYPLGINATQVKQLFDRLTFYGDTHDQPFENEDVEGFATHKRQLTALLTAAERIQV